ncbi:hypothetical protein EIN_080810 [Entamoeba invadens IP1]|uniref:hypothetical protein n=1 Tax=Entamoeba invadens IP1 TaxID=370355 RepID=UPI0002C3F00A|nr:hypothetical protein EIN_080810 [Entamoeba invadens IP1]ELP85109.1 hypothetical protein EIN_080810 [Entamoeba invadens IP1]|eukprot:XP_004184455.1 hypothetical protein EIN_080810 [Entamoeba invadens IP1]
MDNSQDNDVIVYVSVAWYTLLMLVITGATYWNYFFPPFSKTFCFYVMSEVIFLVLQTCCFCQYKGSTSSCVVFLFQRLCDVLHVLTLFQSYFVWANGYFMNVTYGVKNAWNSLKFPYVMFGLYIIYFIYIITLTVIFMLLSGDCTSVVYDTLFLIIRYSNFSLNIIVIFTLIGLLAWFVHYNKRVAITRQTILWKVYLMFLTTFGIATLIMVLILLFKLVIATVVGFANVELPTLWYKICVHHIPDTLQTIAELILVLNFNHCFKWVNRYEY